ncbi:hypothetical protein DPMN_040989 [Dreissena polymorpha]|uniref:G-protein coupled receptors family 1 profile domain-containing protein n=1 Tax=Dreissena polymorpha TaxID=45954 RepID=A0A9D4CX09_DREPO|nr:hypothetical protein DPMN_040989 [Dreissena polymorpha]
MENDTLSICSATINVTCWDLRVRELNANDAVAKTPIIAMMILLMVVGLTGNILVLFVYGKRRNKKSATHFIILLAIMDLIACAIIHPYVIYKLFHPHNQTWDITCKFFEFFIHWNLSLSGLSLLLIAIDRYLAICHPLKYLKFDDHVSKGIALITACSFAFSLPLFEFYGSAIYEIKTDNVILYAYRCDPKVKYQTSFILAAFAALIMGFFLVEVVAMVILYWKVAVVAYRRRNTIRPQLTASSSVASIYPSTSREPIELSNTYHTNNDFLTVPRFENSRKHTFPNKRNQFVGSSNSNMFSCAQTTRIHVKPSSTVHDDNSTTESTTGNAEMSRTNNFESRLKAAKILFCVTAVLFLSWMPFFIVRLTVTTFGEILKEDTNIKRVFGSFIHHLFYLNNAANPII